MENSVWLDWITGGLAIAILTGGLILLLKGAVAMNRK